MTQSLVQTYVSDCMSSDLVTVGPYDNLAKAFEILQKDRIRRLPVVYNDKLIGIITLKDILDAKPSDVLHSNNLSEIYKHLSSIIVQLSMTQKPITIYQTETIGHAAELMLDNKIGGLPVIDADDKLVGLLTESDIFRVIVRKWRDENILSAHA